MATYKVALESNKMAKIWTERILVGITTKVCSYCKKEKNIIEFQWRFQNGWYYPHACAICETYRTNPINHTGEKRERGLESARKSKRKYRKSDEHDKWYKAWLENGGRETRSKYYRERRAKDEAFRWSENIRKMVNRALGGLVSDKHSFEILGCSVDEFIEYIDWMWKAKYGISILENRSEYEIHHIVPIDYGMKSERLDVRKAIAHFTNLVPLTIEDHNKIPKRLPESLPDGFVKFWFE